MPTMPELEGVTHRDVDAGGLRMHLAEAGPEDAPPVLMVHGWPQHWWCWHRIVGDLSRDHRCLMVDLRGHGWTDAPASGYEKEQLATDLLALLDSLGLDRVDYVGHDWGAVTGFLIGFREPERLSSLLAMSVPHLWPSRRDRMDPRRLASLAYQLPISAPLLGKRLMRAGLTRRVLTAASGPGTFSEAEIEAYDSVMRAPAGAATTVALYRTFLLRELPGIIGGRYADTRLDMPTRLIVGGRDMITRNADLSGYEPHAPRMTVEEVDGAGHFLPEEGPELVVARLRELTGIPAPVR